LKVLPARRSFVMTTVTSLFSQVVDIIDTLLFSSWPKFSASVM
jgi:hypothetical protein